MSQPDILGSQTRLLLPSSNFALCRFDLRQRSHEATIQGQNAVTAGKANPFGLDLIGGAAKLGFRCQQLLTKLGFEGSSRAQGSDGAVEFLLRKDEQVDGAIVFAAPATQRRRKRKAETGRHGAPRSGAANLCSQSRVTVIGVQSEPSG